MKTMAHTTEQFSHEMRIAKKEGWGRGGVFDSLLQFACCSLPTNHSTTEQQQTKTTINLPFPFPQQEEKKEEKILIM